MTLLRTIHHKDTSPMIAVSPVRGMIAAEGVAHIARLASLRLQEIAPRVVAACRARSIAAMKLAHAFRGRAVTYG